MANEQPPTQTEAPVRRPRQISEKRRDKKRIADRICQRQARARTKNKIAELESLVAHLTSQSGNEISRDLRDELEKSRAENGSLRRKLATISSLAQVADECPAGTNQDNIGATANISNGKHDHCGGIELVVTNHSS